MASDHLTFSWKILTALGSRFQITTKLVVFICLDLMIFKVKGGVDPSTMVAPISFGCA